MSEKEPEAPPEEITEDDLDEVVGGVGKTRPKRPAPDLVKSAERWLSVEGTADARIEKYSEPDKS